MVYDKIKAKFSCLLIWVWFHHSNILALEREEYVDAKFYHYSLYFIFLITVYVLFPLFIFYFLQLFLFPLLQFISLFTVYILFPSLQLQMSYVKS